MVREDGATKLADFGIASVQGDPRLTATGLVVGSPAYMAPEQVEAQAVSPATDLWALGATLWFAVEGQAPFGGGEFQTLSAIVSGQPRRPERLGPWPPSWPACWSRSRRAARPAQLRPLLRRVVAGGVARPTRPGRSGRRRRPLGGSRRGRRPGRPGRTGRADAGTAGTVLGGTAAEGAERGSVASGDTPPVPGRVRWREGDGAPGAGRREAPGGRLPPVPPVPMPGSRCSPAPAAAGPGPGGVRRRGRGPVRRRHLAGPHPGHRRAAPAGHDQAAGRARHLAQLPGPGRHLPAVVPAHLDAERPGPFIDFTEPGGERFFRVQPTSDGLPPLSAQRSLERSFVARHPGDDYRRLRLGATTFRSVPAAEWEFTFLDEGRLMRGYDITFVASGRRHAILFQAPASRWAASRDELQAFLAGFRPR